MPDSLVLHQWERRSKLYRNKLCIEKKKKNFSLDTIVEAIMWYEYGSSVMVMYRWVCMLHNNVGVWKTPSRLRIVEVNHTYVNP